MVAGSGITDFRVQNLGGAQSNVPFTFGQVFAAGAIFPAEGLAGRLPDGSVVPLQVDAKAAHADGSVRHAIVSGVLPALAAGETKAVVLVKAPRAAGQVDTPPPAARITLTIAGEAYTAELGGTLTPWLAGPIATEGFTEVALKNAAGAAHPLLQARFGVRSYPGQARLEFVVENAKTFVTNSNVTYDVDLELAGKLVYSRKALTHYRRARWHQYFWTGSAPDINIQLNTAYLISTRAVPNYDMRNVPGSDILDALAKSIGPANTGPMSTGPVASYMGTTGGRADIGSLPSWSVQWLLSMDKRARDVMMTTADGAGTWSIHLRDETTGYPVRTDNPKNSTISTHGNIANTPPLAVPRTAGDTSTPYSHDTAHQPSLAYLPYLVTGDYFYLEELQFWAASNPLETAPGYNGNGQGLLRWQQVRGQAWSLRTLGQAAYITPDSHPLKGYFAQQIDSNLDYYHQSFVTSNPNNLGVYDGSGELAFEVASTSPWEDDFLTWSFGYLNDLGFSKALPIAQWKAKYAVGRMTDPGYCWLMASAYNMKLFDQNHKVWNSFADLYAANWKGPTINFDNVPVVSSTQNGVSFADLGCNSQAQADFLGALTGYTWRPGTMVGYSDSAMGYPANLQPALAAALNADFPKAAEAWARFESRTVKPDYRTSPQWAILPWSVPNVMAPPADPATPPAPVTPPVAALVDSGLTLGAKPKDNAAGTWEKAADENGTVKVAADTFVRYGAAGRGYIYAQAKHDFQATNRAMGGDPAPGVVKVVEVFKAAPVPGKIKTGANKKLAKLGGLRVTVFDPATLGAVKQFDGVTATTTGIITVSDIAVSAGKQYALKVEDEKGIVLDIVFPLTATA